MQTAAPAGDARLFVVEQAGRIRVLGADGVLQAAPFLDITADVLDGGERGLLGLAFAPDYASSGQFFVYLTAAAGEVQIRRYAVATGDPARADPASGTVLLRQPHAEFDNHNGGGLRVGPDGKLWAGIGDGGGSDNSVLVGDEYSAQSTQTLLGKLVRINLDGTIPADNPYGNAIWQTGLRNPYRFSFDRGTGNLLIGDVGQAAREELDIATAPALGRGVNWGWPCREGTRDNVACRVPGAVDPSFELTHEGDGAASIIGGVVVRDTSVPGLLGRYLYTDISFPALRSLAVDGTAARDNRVEAGLEAPLVVGIDEDGCGRVVVTSLQGGVYRLVDGQPRPCADPQDPTVPMPAPAPGAPPAPGPAAPGALVGCAATVRAPARIGLRAVRRRGVAVRVSTRAACAVSARLLTRGRRSARRAAQLVAGGEARLRLRPRRAGRRALARTVRRDGGARVTVRLRLRGPADAARTRRLVVRVR